MLAMLTSATRLSRNRTLSADLIEELSTGSWRFDKIFNALNTGSVFYELRKLQTRVQDGDLAHTTVRNKN
jgi:hypothetical protein